jgi:hypothetical protein
MSRSGEGLQWGFKNDGRGLDLPGVTHDSEGIPTPALPAEEGVEYTVAAWDEECFALFAEGRDPGVCPACGRTGFYGPRVGPDGERYRSCRFCGFYQRVLERPRRAQPSVHGCAWWPEVARAPYIWWAGPGEAEYRCPFCQARVKAANHKVTAPSDDPGHPWWKVPQGRNRFYYSRFWENWPYTRGRAFL